jgi:hypothetical protein
MAWDAGTYWRCHASRHCSLLRWRGMRMLNCRGCVTEVASSPGLPSGIFSLYNFIVYLGVASIYAWLWRTVVIFVMISMSNFIRKVSAT